MPPTSLDALEARLTSTRPHEPTFDERRALAWVTRRMFGHEASPPQTLGRYRVEQRLGSGGNGVVYRAHDPLLERTVALKLLRRTAEGPDGAGSRDTLLEESRRIANVEHPNIARVFAVEHDAAADASFIVMEFLSGPTLGAWEASEGPEAEVLADVLARVARGLDAAHERGIVHGDFKPDNVLFDREGQPRIVDFGGRGTPGYIAPELERGDAPSVASDVFAFGNALGDLWRHRPWTTALSRTTREALSRDPLLRPRSLASMVDALQPRRRGWAWPAAALLVAGGVAWMLFGTPASACPLPQLRAPSTLRDDAQAAAVAYVDAWDTARVQACPAPSQDQVQCFERLGLQWERVLPVVEDSPAPAAAAAVLLALEPAEQCVQAQTPDTPRRGPLRAEFDALALALHAAQDLGQWEARGPHLRAQLSDLRARAQALGDVEVEAYTTLYEAIQVMQTGDVEAAAADFEAAYLLGTRAQNPNIGFFAASNLMRIHARHLRDFSEAHRWLTASEAAGAQRDAVEADVEVLQNAATLAMDEGDFARALELYEAIDNSIPDDARIDAQLELFCGMGAAQRALGRDEAALEEFNAGLAFLDERLDRDTLHHGCVLNGIGTTLTRLGRYTDARPILLRLVEMMRREAPRSPDVAAALANLAQVNAHLGDHTLALEQFREVHDTFVALVGPQAEETSSARWAIAEQHYALGNPQDAEVEARAAVRWDAPEPYASAAKLLLARIAFERGDRGDAAAQVDALLADPALPEQVEEHVLEFAREMLRPER